MTALEKRRRQSRVRVQRWRDARRAPAHVAQLVKQREAKEKGTVNPEEKERLRRERGRARVQRWRAKNRDAVLIARRAAMKQWRKDNPDENRLRKRNWARKKAVDKSPEQKIRESRYAIARRRLVKYGLDEEDWNLLFDSQGRKCRICGKKDCARWATDHDHESERVRGILCSNCNTLLGHGKDSPRILRAAAAYLERTATGKEVTF